jgi:hypothetical protein
MASDGHGTTVPSGTQSLVANVPTPILATPNSGYVFNEWGAVGDAYIESQPQHLLQLRSQMRMTQLRHILLRFRRRLSQVSYLIRRRAIYVNL